MAVAARVGQSALEPGEPAVEFRPQADMLSKGAGQGLTRYACRFGQGLDRKAARCAIYRCSECRQIEFGFIWPRSKALKQGPFEVVDSFRFVHLGKVLRECGSLRGPQSLGKSS